MFWTLKESDPKHYLKIKYKKALNVRLYIYNLFIYRNKDKNRSK